MEGLKMIKRYSLMNRTTMNPTNITGNNFDKLFEYCFETCDIVSFRDATFGAGKNFKFLKAIEEFRMCTIQTNRWYGLDFSNYSSTEDWEELNLFSIVYFYRTEKLLKKTLSEYINNLFYTNCAPYRELKYRDFSILEDMCFFRENKLLLGTLSHEHMCEVYPQSNEDVTLFKELLKGEEDEFKEVSNGNPCIDLSIFQKGRLENEMLFASKI